MRSMWKGSISFGLVKIPVKMYTAKESKDYRFNQLHSLCRTPIRYEKGGPAASVLERLWGVQYERALRVFEDEELESFTERTSHTIDILRFVDSRDRSIYYNNPLLEPATPGKGHALRRAHPFRKIAGAQYIRSKPTLACPVYHTLLALKPSSIP